MNAATRRNIAVPAAITAGLLASGLLVWHSSYAAFTATTTSPNNSFSSGTVDLTNDSSGSYAATGSAKFTVTNLVPGQTGKDCITVNYTGSAKADVKLAVAYTGTAPTNPSPAKSLASALTFNIEQIGDDTANCNSAAAATGADLLTSSPTAVDSLVTSTGTSPLGSWTPAADTSGTRSDKKKYRITWELPSGTGNTVSGQDIRGASVAVDFLWTATSVPTP